MANDTQVKIGLGMEHDVGDTKLSKAELKVDYQSMDRDLANILQFEAAMFMLLRLIRKAIMQCAQLSADNMPMYKEFIGDLQKELQELDKLTNRRG